MVLQHSQGTDQTVLFYILCPIYRSAWASDRLNVSANNFRSTERNCSNDRIHSLKNRARRRRHRDSCR